MRKFLFLLLLFPLSVSAGYLGDNLEYSGYLKNELWLRNNIDNGNQSLTMNKMSLDLGIEYKFSDDWALFFHPRLFYDTAYSIRDNDPFDRSEEYMSHSQRQECVPLADRPRSPAGLASSSHTSGPGELSRTAGSLA